MGVDDNMNYAWTCPICKNVNTNSEYCEVCGSRSLELDKFSNSTKEIPSSVYVTPAPTSFVSSNTNNQSKPISSPSPEPSRRYNERFREISNVGGERVLLDNENDYTINIDSEGNVVATNLAGDTVYTIDSEGNAEAYLGHRYRVKLKNKMAIEDFKQNMTVISEDGQKVNIVGGKIKDVYKYDESGNQISELHLNSEGGVRISETATDYYDFDGTRYKTVYPDGYQTYSNLDIVLRPDGTYLKFYNDEEGTYRLDEKGNIIYKDTNGDEVYCDKYGSEYRRITNNGAIYEYDDENFVLKTIINGKTTYSKMDHIEYDEVAYDNILKTLNDINNNDIQSSCLAIKSDINSLPDTYNGDLDGIDINRHFDLIKSLSEMTNYSILAYQICDRGLEGGLHLLIDSLFSENDINLASNFKKSIASSIEDRDGDNILEYKQNVDFVDLSRDNIVRSKFTDEDGNEWYINSNKRVIGVKGDNLKITYGGETFSVSRDENGLFILKDSNGSPLNIFGDYNLESMQYGGRQEDLVEAYRNPYVQNILSKYFPDAFEEEKVAFLNKIARCSCGPTAITDLVFKQFEGNEKEFYDTFGYPMYDISYEDDKLSVDYNYEPLITDLVCAGEEVVPGKNTIAKVTTNYNGSNTIIYNVMAKYLSSNYDVEGINNSNNIKLLTDMGYTLYNLDGSTYYRNGGPHAMVITGVNEKGQTIISSWGKKYIYEQSFLGCFKNWNYIR